MVFLPVQKESTFTLDLPKHQPKNQKNIILRQQKIFTYKKNSFLVVRLHLSVKDWNAVGLIPKAVNAVKLYCTNTLTFYYYTTTWYNLMEKGFPTLSALRLNTYCMCTNVRVSMSVVSNGVIPSAAFEFKTNCPQFKKYNQKNMPTRRRR